MSSKLALGLFAFAFTLTTLAQSTTPWKDKPWEQWDKNDLALIDRGSPWHVKSKDMEVFWTSCRTSRRSDYRESVLENKQKPGDREAVDVTPKYYELLVIIPAKTFVKRRDAGTDFYLMLEKSGRRVLPIEEEGNAWGIFPKHGRKIPETAVNIFRFPRVTKSGDPTIPADEKTVELVWQAGKKTFTVEFDLSQMVDNEGRDL